MKGINPKKINNEINVNIKEEIPNLDMLVKNKIISSFTAEKVKIYKSIIEKKYLKLGEREEKKKKFLNKIEKYLSTISSLTKQEKEDIKLIGLIQENQIYKLTRKKLTMNDFEILKLIGKGGFGEVHICRYKESGKIYAMKKITFERLKYKNGLLHVLTEKDILSLNNDNIWITQLRYSFIDNKYLYLVMDYCPGGDFMNYLILKDILQENEARFYIAEIILCVHNLHTRKCIHRDLKPDNILIAEDGHLKLSDFGLSFISSDKLFPLTGNEKSKNSKEKTKKEKIFNNNSNKFNYDDEEKNIEIMDKKQNIHLNKQMIAYSNVGSPDYVAPEVIRKEGYGEEIDWWSVGAIFYEMLIGNPPFFSESLQTTIGKINQYEKYLSIPNEIKISTEAQQLISDFLSDASKRLGSNGIEEIKNHCFFKDFNWDNIREMKPPFVPKLDAPDDTKYFENKNISNLRFTYRLKRTNAFFNREEEKNDKNTLLFSKFYFQYNIDAVEMEKNIDNRLMDLIKKEVEFKIENKQVFDDISSETLSPSESTNNIGRKNSSRTYSRNRSNNNNFSPHSSSQFSNKTVFLPRKNELQIVPIRNLINKKKSQEKQNNKKKKAIEKTKIKLTKGSGRLNSIGINEK